jgi:hypothetical protein
LLAAVGSGSNFNCRPPPVPGFFSRIGIFVARQMNPQQLTNLLQRDNGKDVPLAAVSRCSKVRVSQLVVVTPAGVIATDPIS